MEITHDVGMVHTRTRSLPLSEATNAIKVPGIDEQSRADGSRWGGVRMYWQNEADSLTGSKPKFRLIELVMKKLGGLFYDATDELIADCAAFSVLIVTQAFGEEVAFKLDDAVINGDGSGKPLGIMNANCLITVNKEAGQATLTVLYANIIKMWCSSAMRVAAKTSSGLSIRMSSSSSCSSRSLALADRPAVVPVLRSWEPRPPGLPSMSRPATTATCMRRSSASR